MQTKLLGKTTRRVSVLGLGLAALGRPGYINLGHGADLAAHTPEAMQAQAHRVLDRAWALGIRYFDAARSYGRGEEFLATWLAQRDHAPDTLTVGSKWGYTYTAGWQIQAERHEVKDHTLPILQRQVAESRALLGPWLHLYQIHSATLSSGVLDRPEVLLELQRQKETGLAIGLSLTGPEQGETLARALDVTFAGVPLFDAVQATWNLLEPSVTPRLAEAHARGRGVILKEALANGRLTARNTAPTFAHQRATLQAEADRLGCTVDALALAAALHQPWADVVLSGAATVQQLESNAAAVNVAWDETAATTLALLAEPAAEYWQTRAGLAWN